ncbi:glycosyltransferase [Prosthecomicrobium sp. N25]|uniref:glycosyltransferase n=1 Tax=Prosthecomicrobium sp. N25 TaxID=3129254 RepID=UPI0030770161
MALREDTHPAPGAAPVPGGAGPVPAAVAALVAGWDLPARLSAADAVIAEDERLVLLEDAAALDFASERGLAPGWYALDLRIRAPIPVKPRLYVDLDGRFEERYAFNLKAGARGSYSAFFRLPRPALALRLQLSRVRLELQVENCRLRRLSALELALAGLRAGRASLRKGPSGLLRFLAGAAGTLAKRDFDSFDEGGSAPPPPLTVQERYRRWAGIEEVSAVRLLAGYREGRLGIAGPPPSFAVVLPATAGGGPATAMALRGTLEAQPYPHWSLHEADPGSGGSPAAALLAAARSLPADAGDWVLLAPPDARFARHALVAFAHAVAGHREAVLAYCDEDRIGEDGHRCDPVFRPAWSEALYHARDYLGAVLAVRASALRDAGPTGPGSAPLTRLVLRHAGTPGAIVHVDSVLVHRTGRAQPIAWEDPAARTPAVAEALSGRATVAYDPVRQGNRVRWRLPDPVPLVTLVVPTRDRADLLAVCIGSVLGKTDYPAYEILVVDNGSVEPATRDLFAELARDPRVRILEWPGAFNFSAINNAAAAAARGEILVLLNNDTEVRDPEWLRELAGWVMQPDVGAVGAKLLYPGGTVQHGGVGLLSRRGVAGHLHLGEPGNARGYQDRLLLPQDLSAVTAACLAVRSAVYAEVGGLDAENLAVAFNDVDFCLRLRRAGYRVVWTPYAELVHHESVSRGDDMAPDKKARFLKEVDHMARTWGAALEADPFYSRHFDRGNGNFMPRAD